MKCVKVVGYMPYSQFSDEEKDDARPSGLTEQLENDLAEELGENLDTITMVLVDEEGA